MKARQRQSNATRAIYLHRKWYPDVWRSFVNWKLLWRRMMVTWNIVVVFALKITSNRQQAAALRVGCRLFDTVLCSKAGNQLLKLELQLIRCFEGNNTFRVQVTSSPSSVVRRPRTQQQQEEEAGFGGRNTETQRLLNFQIQTSLFATGEPRVVTDWLATL